MSFKAWIPHGIWVFDLKNSAGGHFEKPIRKQETVMRAQDLRSYSGSSRNTILDHQAVIQFLPNASGHSRHSTRKVYAPPLKLSGWFMPEYNRASNSRYDGLHVHLGHVGNERNYVVSLVRRDGAQKIAVEYGSRGYTTIDSSPWRGIDFRWGRVYLFEILWERNRITSWVGNELQRTTMEADIPEDLLIPGGGIGFRFDNIECKGGVSVREL